MMGSVRLPAPVRAALLAHAREEAPRECCGLLVGSGPDIDAAVRSANLDPDPARYRLDPAVHIATNRSLRGTGREVVGAYHSHPYSAAVPSPTDCREAYYPEFVWMIVSLAGPQAEAVAAYRLRSGGFEWLPIEVTGRDKGGSSMNVVESIRDEYLRYKNLAEAAIRQAPDDQLSTLASADSNSIAAICWHVSGNLKSRFTEFLTADGEKPWRNREEEFAARPVERAELLAKWNEGWTVLLAALSELTDDVLSREVVIRGQKLLVVEALHRSLAHTSYHVGQIVFIAKAAAGPAWTSLSIPKGQSATYNQNPTGQTPAEQIAALEQRSRS
jgi:proteasome lid subunit RPN8/RPN11